MRQLEAGPGCEPVLTDLGLGLNTRLAVAPKGWRRSENSPGNIPMSSDRL